MTSGDSIYNSKKGVLTVFLLTVVLLNKYITVIYLNNILC